MTENKCPLCDDVASITGVDFGRKARISCPKCKNMITDPATMELLTTLPKESLCEISQSSAGLPISQILLIYTTDFIEEESGRTGKNINLLIQQADKWT